ncbi:nuclear pore complex protein Nup160 homolog isoform X2 [Ostrinia furnacalis]|uniref:nuclear pore complex protein Nup160 homolog isoform X1 n=1 Tax=Ostrinia furnacalis TaxID=93504 RepID=UPI00103C357D|nr:nuclear pore complex protein Nup160 homolog isoform X1 [Ostrinia furnacalis]XP_028172523.1 nuclear pore complex protein Nup160 homolog isoform X2 [Ostrinia furnacalis]
MEFIDAIPVTFKEITPNHNIPEKWKEIVLNTGGTHSTLQDIKLPQKAGGYWYRDSKKANTRNRFIYWQTTPDSIELSEASLDVNLSGANLRCKVPGTPPLNSITIYERPIYREIVILAATVSSVHRLTFPHPEVLDKKSTFGSLSTSSPSIFQDTSALNNPNNYFILNQYTNATTGVAHTCSSLLRENGEALFALAFGIGGEGGLLLVKLPVSGSAVTVPLKRESAVPRFLSGITGALRGKSTDGLETYGVVLTHNLAVAICGDTCLRAWGIDEGGAPVAVSPPLAQTVVRPKPPPHGHMLQKSIGTDGSVMLVAYISFPDECEFVVMKMHDGGAGVKFSHICRIFGPQLDLFDYSIGYGEGTNVIWALWSQPDGETIITSSVLGAEVSWRAVAGREPAPPLPQLASHQQYRDRLLAPGLFPPSVVNKALVIYRRTWGSNETSIDGDLSEAALNAVQTRLRHLIARASAPDHSHLMHKCWSDLYSWCMQYMEGLQKPLGLMVSTHGNDVESGWWCAVVRRAGISLVRELEPLERMMLSPDLSPMESGMAGARDGELSADAVRVVLAGARWERAASAAGARELERRLFAAAAPQHRLLPRLLHLLQAPAPAAPDATPHAADAPILSPQQIDELTSILEPIKDLQNAVLELNDALRLDVPEIDTSNHDDEDTSEYDNLFASDLGVSVITEAIRQMAEMRSRVVRGALAALGVSGGAGGVPGAGHCAVHWQAYRALLWLRAATLTRPAASSAETFRLKLSALGAEASAEIAARGGVGLEGAAARAGAGVVGAYARSAGGQRARAHLAAARAPDHWHHALPLLAYHIAHQLWAVSGGFEFGWWLASINQPRLVQSYVAMLEPWCEWNACSRQFILGLSLLDLEDSESAYTAFCKAAKGVSTEPFLRQLVAAPDARLTQHQALVLYYMKVIKLFEIHDAGACVVRLAETAISIADKDDPNLAMFQWLVFKWHLSGGRVERALAAAAASPAPTARAAAAATLLTTLASRKQLGALVKCAALGAEAERAAAARAKLHDAHGHNPYYDFLYALHVSRHHYRKAAAVMYERASRCAAERGNDSSGRRKWLAAALTCLRLARPEHAFLARPPPPHHAPAALQVIGPKELEAELRAEDPDSLDEVQQALNKNENIDFKKLYPKLKDADAETLLAVTKRVLSTGQFLPHWFLQRYMDVDAGGCIRALLRGGRCVEAAEACSRALRTSLAALRPLPPHPRAAPLALADLLLAELAHHKNQPYVNQVYNDLDSLVKEYIQVVIRTSEDMKLATIQ